MNLQELEKLILKQSKLLIKYKDAEVKPLLQAYKALLDQLMEEITKMYVEDNDGQQKWDWKAISRSGRIESLFLQLEKDLYELAKTTENNLKVAMKNIIKTDYALASFMTAKQLNDWIPIPPVIPKRALKEVMDIPWSGDHFSSRVWHNKDLLKTNLRRELTRAVVTGDSFIKTTKRIKDVMGTEAYKAERLVRSEMIAASNRGQKRYYKQFNERFEKYNMLSGVKVLETLDRKTCSRCRATDGQEFTADEIDSIEDIEHPNCRRRLVPIIRGFDESKITRAARGEDGKYYRTSAKNFKEFAQEQGIPDYFS